MEDLEVIIQRMIDAGESEESIKLVIEGYDDFKLAETEKPGKKKATDKGASVGKNQAPKLQLTDTVSPSVDIFLESQPKLNTKNAPALIETGTLVRREDVLDYESTYSDFQKNRNSELRAITLKNNNIDIAAPAINENLLKAKINQIVDSKQIKSKDLPEKEYNSIVKDIFQSDTYLSKDLPLDILKTYSKEINAKKKLIEKKYNLDSQEEVNKANDEFSTFQNKLINIGLQSNETYKSRLESYQLALGNVLNQKQIDYNRNILGVDENTYPIVEGIQKGYRQIGLSVKKSFTAAESESLQEDQSEFNRIQGLDEEGKFTYGGSFIPNVGWSGTQTGSKEDALKFYKEKITNKKANLLSNIKENVAESELISAFKEANLEDGITLSDIGLLVGEQALQLPIAYLTYGTGIFAQEFGNAYFGNIEAYLDKKNLKPTPENILAAAEKGEGDAGLAVAVGAVNSALEKVGADQIANGIFGKVGKKAITSIINDGFIKYVKSGAIKEVGLASAKGGFVEFLTEGLQTTTEQLGKGLSVNDVFGYIDTKEIQGAAKAGGIVGLILPLGGKAAIRTVIETKNAAITVAAKFNPEATLNYLNATEESIKKSDQLNQSEKIQQLEALSEVRNANIKVPKFIVGKEKEEAINLIIEKKALENVVANSEPNLVLEEKAAIELINEKIKDIAVKSKVKELGESDIAKAEAIAKALPDLKLSINAFNTSAELEETLIAEGETATEAKKKSSDFGFISQKADGTQTIYINKEVAFESNVATTAQHEVLHAILKNAIPGNIELGKSLNAFVQELTGNKFNETEYGQRFQQYEIDYKQKINKINSELADNTINSKKHSEKSKVALENLWEETMPLLSEAITRGDIESNSTIWEKFKDFVNMVFNTSNIKNVKFNEGKDVFNFVKDYNKIYKSGRGIKTLSKVVAGDISGDLISASKQSKFVSGDKTSLNATDKQTAASEKVQKLYGIYSNPETTASVKSRVEGDIAAQFMGSVNKIVSGYRDRPGFKTFEEDLLVDVVTQAGGLLTLIRKYDPSKNDSLAAFVNTYLKVRAIPIINKTLGIDEASTFKSDVTEVKDVTATESAEDSINASEEIAKEKPKVKKQKIKEKLIFDNELNEKLNTALIKSISLNIKKFDSAKGKNQTISTFVANIKMDLAELLEKDVTKFIKDQGVESFLIENREVLLNNLTTTFLAKHPFFRKGILKRVKGEWVAPIRISEYLYKWIDKNGDALKIDRDNASERGLTSGPEFIKRNPDIKTVLKENEFVDYHFQDGALRKKTKSNPISSIARQIGSEYSLEVLQDDLLSQGNLTKEIAERADLYGIVVAEASADQLIQDIDRGVIKFSAAFTSGEIRNKIIEGYIIAAEKGAPSLEYKSFISNLGDIGESINNTIQNNLWAVELMQEEANRNNGLKYEEAIKKIISYTLKRYPLGTKIKLIKDKKQGGFSNKPGGDITIGFESFVANIELKLNSLAQSGSFTIKNAFGSGNIKTTYPTPSFQKIQDKINTTEYQNAISKYLYEAKKMFKLKEFNSFNLEDYNFDIFPTNLPGDIVKKLKETGAQNGLSFEINIDINEINDFYAAKNVNYIQIEGRGMFTLGNDILNLEALAPVLSGEGKIRVRLVPSSASKAKNRTQIIRAFYNLEKINSKSKFNLSNPADIKTIIASGAAISEINKSSKAGVVSMNTAINKMLERKKGILATEIISKTTATLAGAKKGKYNIIVPPSAEDFEGLIYNFIGSKEQGNKDKEFFNEKLFRPLARANFNLNAERQVVKRNYKSLLDANKGILKLLREESDYKYYNNDSAVRVYMWDKLGYEIPGIIEADKIALIKAVENNPKLLKFVEELVTVPNKKESWLKPEDGWTASTIEMDLQEILSKIGRARIFEEFIENADIIFSEDNLNKIQAAYGPSFRSALDDMLFRIKKGRARGVGDNKLANTYLNWVRGSVATTMFFNTRSALLQQLSIVNFTNWEENNVLAQGKFLASNPKEYAKYWAKIFNSDWMKERRQGLKTDINEAELAAAVQNSKNPNKAILSYILQKGFALTKYGDNIAIATGGASYLYHREKMYIKNGLTETKAKEEAFLDFQEIAEKTQQSSRQDLLSNQQVSVIGRLFLAFQNTPMQMTRLTKKAALDLINGRGSAKANISKIIYYSTVQNIIFSYLQNALFAIAGLDDDEDEKLIDQKTERAINNVIDGFLRGAGIGGAVVASVKNAILAWKKEDDKDWNANNSKVLLELLNVSPAVAIKARKLYGAMDAYKYNKKILDQIGYDNPNHPYYRIAGSLASGAFNVPLDRVITKVSNLKAIGEQDAAAWQRAALFLGWNTWDLGIKDAETEKARATSKRKSKKSSAQKADPMSKKQTKRKTIKF